MRDYDLLIQKTPPAYQAWLADNPDEVLQTDVIGLYSRDSLPERNETNEMETFLPDHLIIGDDSGDYVFVMRCSSESPVYIVDHGSLRLDDLQEIAPSFSVWLESGFPLPEEPEYHLPLRADIYVDRVGDLKTMFALQ